MLQVRPWAVSQPSCYLAGLDCHLLGITGKKSDVFAKWSDFDSSTVVYLLVRHCPELEVPDTFTEFHQLREIKMYNTTISEWGESAAVTNTHHPSMASLFLVRVNMTDGRLPPGLQSHDFPRSLKDVEICITNLHELPDDLDSKWPRGSVVQIEYGRLTAVPGVLARLEPSYLFLTGNPIVDLPPDVFQVPGMMYLGVSSTHIRELPRDVLEPGSMVVYISQTNISTFWSWMDELIRSPQGIFLIAGDTPYCQELESILTGNATTFGVEVAAEYSSILMDPTEANMPLVQKSIKCNTTIPGLYHGYPLANEDRMNAVSTPPDLVQYNI